MKWDRIRLWVRGWVLFSAEGGEAGRLLTLAARDGIFLCNTHCRNSRLTAVCPANRYRALRPAARRCGARLHIHSRGGAAFWVRRYRKRVGIPVGAAIYAALLLFLSQFIWSLDIRDTTQVDPAALQAFLVRQNVFVGAKKSAVDSEKVKIQAVTALNGVSWLAVNLNGNIAEVEIKGVETAPLSPGATAPSNLVAARDGVVVAVEITEGETLVQVGSAVAAGNLLASGVTQTARETLMRRSAGRVLAETERILCVSVPLNEEQRTPTGPTVSLVHLRLFGLELPLHSAPTPLSPDEGQILSITRNLTVGGTTLPCGFTLTHHTAWEYSLLQRTAEQALREAEQRLTALEQQELATAEIRERAVSEELTDDVLTLTARYRCVEDIALEVPLNIGEF